jgi:hypothetical protein
MNATVRLPAGITATQSFSWVLREAIIDALTPSFAGFTIVRTDRVPVQVWQLPVLGVYLKPERMTPDGDWNAGDVRFVHDFQIGFSVIIADNDGDAAEQKLDAVWWAIMTAVWANVGLMNLVQGTTVDNTRMEGCTLGVRRFVYGAMGKNNETPVAELQYEITCRYRTGWPPAIADTLNLIVLTVVPAGVDSTQTQTIEVQYDFTTTG